MAATIKARQDTLRALFIWFLWKMSLLAIKYERGQLEILNQLLLPHESIYEEIQSVEDGWGAIRSMKVRSRQWPSRSRHVT